MSEVTWPRPRTPIRKTLLVCWHPTMSGAARRPPLKPTRNARLFMALPLPTSSGRLPREPGSRRPAFEERPSDAAGSARSGTCRSTPPACVGPAVLHRRRRPAAGRLPRPNVRPLARLWTLPLLAASPVDEHPGWRPRGLELGGAAVEVADASQLALWP